MRSRGGLVRTFSGLPLSMRSITLKHLLSTIRQTLPRRTCGDVMLCGITLAELSLLVFLTPTFTALDWIYVLQHVIVFGVALTRPPPRAQDYSWRVAMACLVSYAYPYAQILYLGYRARLLCLAPAWTAPGGGRGGVEPSQSPHPGPMVRHPPSPALPGPDGTLCPTLTPTRYIMAVRLYSSSGYPIIRREACM